MEEYPSIIDLKEKMGQAFVSSLYIYPIKSCAGLSLNSAEVVATGFRHDRELMLVYPDGLFITQRRTNDPNHKERAKHPTNKLALVKPSFIDEDLLKVEAPGMSDLFVEVTREGTPIETAVHKQGGIQVVSQGVDAVKWFREYLGFDCLLVAMAESYTRQVDLRYAQEGNQTVFADGFPFLLASEESLDDLNRRREAAGFLRVPMNRTRPNIVIKGSGIAYSEDYLRKIKIGDVVFDVLKPCARCEITGNNQETGERTDSRTATLATLGYRHGANLLGGSGSFLFQNLVHQNMGRVSIGDVVNIINIDNKPNFVSDRVS